MACERKVFTAQVTRIPATWLNAVDKIRVIVECAETKDQMRAALDLLTSVEIQQLINNLQSQININASDIDDIEACLPSGYCFQVVASLPATPNPNIIYFVTGA